MSCALGLMRCGVRNQPLARALGRFEALSTGAGSFSFAYETEEVREKLGECLSTDDAREGVTAFLEKRAPAWKGR